MQKTLTVISLSDLIQAKGADQDDLNDILDGFTFGDADYTLISKARLIQACEAREVLDFSDVFKAALETLADDVYVDLES